MKYILQGHWKRKENGEEVLPKQVVSLDHLTDEAVTFLVTRGIYKSVPVKGAKIKGDK